MSDEDQRERLWSGECWRIWRDDQTDDKSLITLCHRGYNLFLAPEEFAELVMGVNKVAYEVFKTRSEISR